MSYVFADAPITSTAFTCTSSSFYSNDYTCDKLYDDNEGTEWYTKAGKAQNSWVKIDFNDVLRLSQIQIKQVGANFGAFKTIRISFSNGQSQDMDLSDVETQWNIAAFSPPIDTTNLQLSAIDYYTPENLGSYYYHLGGVRFYGALLNGKR